MSRALFTFAPDRRLPEPDPGNRSPAEKAVDPFADHAGEMLNLDCGGTIDPQHQRSGLALLAVGRPQPLDLDRLAARGNVRTDDLGPARYQLGRGKALLSEGVTDGFAKEREGLFMKKRSVIPLVRWI
jgi:hypothetical protein